jgi:hypothetical protein
MAQGSYLEGFKKDALAYAQPAHRDWQAKLSLSSYGMNLNSLDLLARRIGGN